jgi:hypothetical protein
MSRRQTCGPLRLTVKHITFDTTDARRSAAWWAELLADPRGNQFSYFRLRP